MINLNVDKSHPLVSLLNLLKLNSIYYNNYITSFNTIRAVEHNTDSLSLFPNNFYSLTFINHFQGLLVIDIWLCWSVRARTFRTLKKLIKNSQFLSNNSEISLFSSNKWSIKA